MSERKKHIAVLKEMLEWMNMSSEVIIKDDPFFIVHEHRKKAVKYAISSLETDEAYQLEYESTIKNDLPHCQHTDKEIAKSFIEDFEAVKEHLPCGEQMDFPNTFDEFAKSYGFRDKKEIYTNGSELIPVFRVKQWLEHISITKNDLGVDAISRADARSLICNTDIKHHMSGMSRKVFKDLYNGIDELHPVTPIRPEGHWIKIKPYPLQMHEYECSECGHETDDNTESYCSDCGAKMVEPQESEE